ncbi:hypothetical protein PCC9214_05359 [Planktothrix tepida]|uniref:Uncharacterized protein n=1 Tax=Planktothrix tepida PCC 9214 TaxID=671072 RepID=A0A1J1LI17_9CYAN|nr:hypothetical protein [Planktothrix tepida]CAD5984951.1 hypothetical protein PCC9214_05321 [Planktothrix tepida]CAD5985226.1 hypothetical protein PCC9214_05359 [Planktothrix tepida]CUR32131.1 hypothetical protein PL9214430103 [Planktothrix tepida PCC 9214]
MNTDQMTLEQQHDESENVWEIKYKLLKSNYDYISKEIDQKRDRILELSQQLKDREAQIKKLTETVAESEIKIKAVHSISQVTGKTSLTHAQRRAIAWVQESILAGEKVANPSFYDEF